jgi:hypothetical protein
MRFQFYYVFYLLNSHHNVSAANAAIFRVMLLLQEQKDIFAPLYYCNNIIALKMAALAAETCC